MPEPAALCPTKTEAVFGPVASRRLGLSLGIDLLDFKTCNLNCVYCELGATAVLSARRGRFRDYRQVLRQVELRLARLNTRPDSLTLAGSGEPTLHLDLGKTLDGLKAIANIQRVVLTNSTLTHLSEVRRELSRADIVAPSLDAVSPEVFAQINRPAPGLNPQLIIDGLTRLRRSFKGQMWLEILLVRGLNDHESELDKLCKAAMAIAPDLVQLNTIVRPPASSGYQPLDNQRLLEIAAGFTLPTQVAAQVKTVCSETDNNATDNNVRELIAHTTSLRPCTLEDLLQITGLPESSLRPLLRQMRAERQLNSLEFDNRQYYQGNK